MAPPETVLVVSAGERLNQRDDGALVLSGDGSAGWWVAGVPSDDGGRAGEWVRTDVTASTVPAPA